MNPRNSTHTNEIAQSEAATGKTYANAWMHCGMIRINGEKMSKSLNNFFTIRDVLDKYHPEVVRYLLVSSHYRSAINYSEDNLKDAKGGSLVGGYDAAAVTGTVVAGGKTWHFTARPVTKPAGLYRATPKVKGKPARVGWIVLPDGSQVGILTADESTAAPALDPAARTATASSGGRSPVPWPRPPGGRASQAGRPPRLTSRPGTWRSAWRGRACSASRCPPWWRRRPSSAGPPCLPPRRTR